MTIHSEHAATIILMKIFEKDTHTHQNIHESRNNSPFIQNHATQYLNEFFFTFPAQNSIHTVFY